MSLGLEPEEKILLTARIGRFLKRMLKIKELTKGIRESGDFQNLKRSSQDKFEEIESLASKKEDDK